MADPCLFMLNSASGASQLTIRNGTPNSSHVIQSRFFEDSAIQGLWSDPRNDGPSVTIHVSDIGCLSCRFVSTRVDSDVRHPSSIGRSKMAPNTTKLMQLGNIPPCTRPYVWVLHIRNLTLFYVPFSTVRFARHPRCSGRRPSGFNVGTRELK